MKTLRFSILFLLVGTSFAIYDTDWHDAGLLTVKLSNYGTFGSENAGIWPRGASESYIFGAGIWVGGLKPDTLGTSLTADSTLWTRSCRSARPRASTRSVACSSSAPNWSTTATPLTPASTPASAALPGQLRHRT
jgi:hypothetical protein